MFGRNLKNISARLNCGNIEFIDSLIRNGVPYQIHPPFNNYIEGLEEFIEIYSIFESRIYQIFPDTKIFIENRRGIIYRQGSFLISKDMDMVNLSELIRERKLSLRIVLGIPQLLTAHSRNNKTVDKLIKAVGNLKKCVGNIEGIHLWVKRPVKMVGWCYMQGILILIFLTAIHLRKYFWSIFLNFLTIRK